MLGSVPLAAFLALLLLSSCTAWNRSAGERHYSTPFTFTAPAPAHPLADLDPDHPAASAAPSAPSAPAQPRRTTALRRLTAGEVSLTLLTFDDREISLQVADKADGPPTQWQSAEAAARAHRALAAINASFFTPEGQPLGLVIEDGRRFGTWNPSSSLTSGVLVVQDRQPRLLRRTGWNPSSPATHLVQAGPLLLERGETVPGLSTASRRPRSFIAWDGRHHWAIGSTRSATLAGLASALATQPLPGLRLETALNLDGGRSSDLWIGPEIEGGPLATRKIWNKPVRNYVLLKGAP